MEELIARIAASAGTDVETARRAVGAILAFLRKEGQPADVDDLFAHLPGAEEAAAAAAAQNEGVMSGFMAMMGGGLMGLAARLTGLGLTMTQMRQIGHEVFAFAESQAGRERVRAAAAKIPGASQFF
ncbi:DUF2267 domain-containing protein [Methylocella sp.]|uniref:DUF2267 domain-containing protein n=1 Tax=Methylocella sp. TaxID=1978226 RepID=UPI003783DD9E